MNSIKTIFIKTFFVLVFLPTFSFANSRMTALESPVSCLEGKDTCVLDLFIKLARVYRPSGEEKFVTSLIQTLFNEAKVHVWKNQGNLTIQLDQVGNVVIRVPATGVYASKSVQPIALQAHMDMILAVKGAAPGQDLKPYFVNGVQVSVTDGWMHSRDNLTTLGADNGAGVALALRYLYTPKLDHPPLELVFTTQEENCFCGALGLAVLQSKRMINLDGMTADAVTVGSLGGSVDSVAGYLPFQELPPQYRVFKMSVSDLQGGHSGLAIHLPNANAIKSLAQVLKTVITANVKLELISFISGDLAVANKIPNSAEVVFAIQSAVWDSTKLTAELKKVISQFQGENPATYKVAVLEYPRESLHLHSARPEISADIINRILNVPHGVISTDGRFPNSVKTSTNLASLLIQPITTLSKQVFGQFAVGFMGRSFIVDELLNITSFSSKVLTEAWMGSQVDYKNKLTSYPWIAPSNSPLLKIAMNQSGGQFRRQIYFSAGIEPSVFSRTQPGMDIISIGPDIVAAHTPNEKLRVNSVFEVMNGLQNILQTLN